MRDPKRNGRSIVFGPVRLSYTHLLTPYGKEGEKKRYSTKILIPKDEKKTLKAINEAIEAAREEAVTKNWGGKNPKSLDISLRDGDEKEDPTAYDHYFINAYANTRPGVVDKNRVPIVDEDEVYSGMWAYVSISFYGYDNSGKRGIAAGLNNIMKYKDDDRLGGRSSAENDFEGFDDEEDDDL